MKTGELLSRVQFCQRGDSLECGRGKATKGTYCDELEDETKFSQLPHILFHLLLPQPCLFPIETWAQVVRQPLTRMDLMYPIGKLFGLRVDGGLGLHPKEIGIRCKCNGTVYSALGAALVAVVTLAGTGCVP